MLHSFAIKHHSVWKQCMERVSIPAASLRSNTGFVFVLQVWSFSAASPRIVRLADVPLLSNTLSTTVPCGSITMLVFKSAASPSPGPSPRPPPISPRRASPPPKASPRSPPPPPYPTPPPIPTKPSPKPPPPLKSPSPPKAARLPPSRVPPSQPPQLQPLTTLAFTSAATASPSASTELGTAVILIATVTITQGALTNGILDLEVYDRSGSKQFQQFVSGQRGSVGTSLHLSCSWVAPVVGNYTVTLGVFNGDWSVTYHWNPSAAVLSVVAPASMPDLASYAWLMPAAGTASAQSRVPATILTAITLAQGSTPPSSFIVDLEIYVVSPTGSSDVRVYQDFKSGQTFPVKSSATGDKTLNNSWSWVPPAAGTYAVRLGVFDSQWAVEYHWNNDAMTITAT